MRDQMVKAKKPAETDNLDMNDDGVVTKTELNVAQVRAETRKMHAQEKMAWSAIGAIITFTAILLFLPTERIDSLSNVSNLFYISMASIVGAFMGMTAYMSSVNAKK